MPPMPPRPPAPVRPGSDPHAAAAPQPPRATTQTLLAAGAHTEDVAVAERAIAATLLASPATALALGVRDAPPAGAPEKALPVEIGGPIRKALVVLANSKLEEGQRLMFERMKAAAVPARIAYWQAVAELDPTASDHATRPTLRHVLDTLARARQIHREDDVRLALDAYALQLAPGDGLR